MNIFKILFKSKDKDNITAYKNNILYKHDE